VIVSFEGGVPGFAEYLWRCHTNNRRSHPALWTSDKHPGLARTLLPWQFHRVRASSPCVTVVLRDKPEARRAQIAVPAGSSPRLAEWIDPMTTDQIEQVLGDIADVLL
jgi:hypothetical protein